MKIVHMITGFRHFTFQFPSNPWSPPGFFIKADETLVLERTECLLLWESSSLFLSISALDWSAIATANEIAFATSSLDIFHFSSFFFAVLTLEFFSLLSNPTSLSRPWEYREWVWDPRIMFIEVLCFQNLGVLWVPNLKAKTATSKITKKNQNWHKTATSR